VGILLGISWLQLSIGLSKITQVMDGNPYFGSEQASSVAHHLSTFLVRNKRFPVKEDFSQSTTQCKSGRIGGIFSYKALLASLSVPFVSNDGIGLLR
jgi:hypothetical protein